MRQEFLASLIERPEVHRELLGEYTGPYALGTARDPNNPDDAMLMLIVPSELVDQFPRKLWIAGHSIKVIVKGGLKMPYAALAG